jgi:PAS domain S-box-containing protein
MLRENVVKRVVTIFVLVLIILSYVAYVTVDNVRRSRETGLWVENTHAIILETDAIISSLHEGDAALRSFLITGDSRDQSSYRSAYQEMVEHLEVAKALTKKEAGQNQRIAGLEPLLAKRIDYTRSVMKARQDGGYEGVRKKLVEDSGGESLRDIEKAIARIQDKEKGLLRDRDKVSYAQAQATRWVVYAGIGINLVLLCFTALTVRDDIHAREIAKKALQDANAMLEAKVAERTADLAAANEILRAENLERQWGNKALEHQLRYSNLIINSINDLVFVLTKTLNITRVNPAVSHQTGLETKDLITSPLARVVRAKAGQESPQQQLAQALRDGRELQDIPVELVSKQGAAVPYRLSLFPLRDRDKVVGGVVTLRIDFDKQETPNPSKN